VQLISERASQDRCDTLLDISAYSTDSKTTSSLKASWFLISPIFISMQLLEKFVRHVLVEAGGAKTPEDLMLSAGSFVIVSPDDEQAGAIQIYYGNSSDDPPITAPEGRVAIMRVKEHPILSKGGPALGAYMVVSSDAIKGWGPMLYDVAMEIATVLNGGLTPDRGNVSASAKKIWDFYYNNRTEGVGGSLSYSQLDDPSNTLTPDPDDNALQWSAQKWDGSQGWHMGSLSKVYYSSGTPVIDKLRSLGLIEFEGINI
jgi:hypothetical protein